MPERIFRIVIAINRQQLRTWDTLENNLSPRLFSLLIDKGKTNVRFLLNLLRYVFADILESERSYVADLQRIIEIYLYELTRQECPWFVKEKKDLLFSNIEDIFAFHKV